MALLLLFPHPPPHNKYNLAMAHLWPLPMVTECDLVAKMVFRTSWRRHCMLSGSCLYKPWSNKNALTEAFSLACLEIRSRNEEAIYSVRKRIYSLKGFLLPTLSSSILFICFWIDLVRLLATTGNTSAVAGYTRKFKGLDSREITSLPEIIKVIYMARHFNHRRK